VSGAISGLIYGLLWVLARFIGWLCFRYRAVGGVPRIGGILIAANHASFLDIPLLGCGVPRRVWFLGRHDLFPIPLLNGVLQALGWIPLRVGRLDREAFAKAVSHIKAGRAVAIFPEGTRSTTGKLRAGKPGIGMIVTQTGCPVVPAYIKGTHEALPVGAFWPRFRRVTVMYGPPLDFSEDLKRLEGKALYQHVSRTVMTSIAALGRVSPPVEPGGRSDQPSQLASTLAPESCNAE
jgi:1-acyl-sn-glycerol-3-phosphate acyltransferase